MKNNHSMVGLASWEYEEVLEILKDIRSSSTCGIAIGGSVAQRILRPELAHSFRNKPLADVDVILLGGEGTCQVLPSIKERFFITHINPMEGGYYFGMTHKKSLRWVDLFAVPYEKEYAKVNLDGDEYLASTIESQILYLANDILSRIQRKAQVRNKWVEKLSTLWSLAHLEYSILEEEYAQHKSHFMMQASSAREFIERALSDGAAYATPYTMTFRLEYPSDCVVTDNGISIEDEQTFRRTLRRLAFRQACNRVRWWLGF